MQDQTLHALWETRRRIWASALERQASRDAHRVKHLILIERSQVAVAQSRILLSLPVITPQNIQSRPR